MKKQLTILFILFSILSAYAQENIDDLLAAGISDAKQFTTDYIAPASQGLVYGINNGWFNNGKSPKRFAVELSIIGNTTFIKDKNKSFEMKVADYQNIRFQDNSTSKTVATALGHNDPDITIIVTYDDPIFGNQEAELILPTGIGSANVNLIPTAFLQASFSPFKGTQIKGRYFPKLQLEDTEIGLYGLGLQQELTAWLPADNLFPVAVSGLIAYTHLDGSYDFTEVGIVDGENQQVQTDVNTLLLELIVATKLKIINFYGGVGYINGKSNTDLTGIYQVKSGPIFSEEIVDPFSIKKDVSGIRATIGANLKVGFFSLNADYSVAEFDSASVGLGFSF